MDSLKQEHGMATKPAENEVRKSNKKRNITKSTSTLLLSSSYISWHLVHMI